MFFFIIFGTKGRITNAGSGDTLERACPKCQSNLYLKNASQWFTLFFIPIFPIRTVDSFYQCDRCSSSYKHSARRQLLEHAEKMNMSQEHKADFEKKAKEMYLETLVACMTLMTKIDGDIDEREIAEVNKVIDEVPDYRDKLTAVMQKVRYEDSERYVEDLLGKCKENLTSEGILSILARSMKVLNADGRIDREEERLMKDYLEICGFPKSFYNLLLEKMKASA